MLTHTEPLKTLPADIQRDWMAQLFTAPPHPAGAFRLVNIRRTPPKSFEELRLVVTVIDEDDMPMGGVKVAFAYSTAHPFIVGEDFTWSPPERRADIVVTDGGGRIEHIQGSVVKQGQPGGITAFIVEPAYASDYLTGLGALADHTGLSLLFQLRRQNVVPLAERLDDIERRLKDIEQMIDSLREG